MFDPTKVKIDRGIVKDLAPLPRLSVRDQFANTKRCKTCQMITPTSKINPETGVCVECEGIAEEKAGIPRGMTVQTTVSMPKSANNAQIDGILKALESIGSVDTLKALEIEREGLQDRLKAINGYIVRLKALTGFKRKYARRVKVS